MGTPIYILAGQSNANAMKDEFSAALAKAVPSGDYHAALVATGGSPLTRQREGDDWLNGGELRADLYQTIKKLLQQDPDAHLGGIIWVQGEADTYAMGRPDKYSEMMQDLLDEVGDALRDDFAGRSVVDGDINLVISGLSDYAPDAPRRVNWREVQDQQKKLAATSGEIQLIDPDKIATQNGYNRQEMFKDGAHYSNDFQVTYMNVLVGSLTANENVTPPDNFYKGTGGADRFVGTRGDDTYLINHSRDKVLEAAGQGFDTVVSDGSILLNRIGANIEAVILTGDNNTKGFGNRQKNDLQGNAGNNTLKGNLNDDYLNGNAGNDRLFGGSGNDTLVGGLGWDQFSGGGGRDVFVFSDEDRRWSEQILDYNATQDIIRFDTAANLSFDNLRIFDDDLGRGTVINYRSGSILLLDVDKSELSADSFDFI